MAIDSIYFNQVKSFKTTPQTRPLSRKILLDTLPSSFIVSVARALIKRTNHIDAVRELTRLGMSRADCVKLLANV